MARYGKGFIGPIQQLAVISTNTEKEEAKQAAKDDATQWLLDAVAMARETGARAPSMAQAVRAVRSGVSVQEWAEAVRAAMVRATVDGGGRKRSRGGRRSTTRRPGRRTRSPRRRRSVRRSRGW